MAKDRLDIPIQIAGKRIWVTGHRGMVGSALCRRLALESCKILTVGREELDLRNQAAVRAWMDENRPEIVIMAAAKVGGIKANDAFRADFMTDNILMNINVLQSSHEFNVERLLVLGSSCIYPRDAAQPIREEMLLTGSLESTNEAYALAKIAALKAAEYYRHQYGCDFIAAMPCNLYGVGDRYDAENSHVIPALIMKLHAAKIAGSPVYEAWGSGNPLREFMEVDDLADALVFILKHYGGQGHINVGSGWEISIRDLINIIAEVIGYEGKIAFNANFLDGTPRKIMDSSRLNRLGWENRLCQNDDANMLELMKREIRKCYSDYLDRVLGNGCTR